ncbi:MAG: hypothetical protein K9J77_04045 [Rhodoferax sp.]|nr:hypothetical protein [Rhodoferax sp.]
MQVNGGTINGKANTTPYHSIAAAAGTVNITPLTDLVVAQLAGAEPKTWFTAPKFDAVTADSIATALGTVSTTLGLASTLGNLNPMTTAFEAKPSDTIDKVLQALGKAWPTLFKNYSEMLTATANKDLAGFSGFGTAFATAHSSVAGSTSPGTGTGTSASCTTGQISMAYDGVAGVFTKGDKVCMTATTTSLAFSGKTLSNPVQNTAVSAPYSAYKFSDSDGSVYEVTFKDAAIHEINVLKGTTFQGQLTPVSASTGGTTGGTTTGGTTGGSTTTNPGTTGNLTITFTASASGISIPATAIPNIVIPNIPTPQSQSEFCGPIKDDKNLLSAFTAMGSFTVDSCSYSGKVGNIAVTISNALIPNFTFKYTVVYTFGG